jgi:cytochrome c oxidase assembly factor CtaG
VVTVAVLAAYAVAYLARARTLSRRGRAVPAWRVACFIGGLFVFGAAVEGPLAARADERMTAHMLEHLLIADVASLLLVLGLTGPLLAPLLRRGPLGRLRALGHPAVAVLLWTANLALWHLPFAYEAAVRHDLVHVAQHACFLVAGMTLWLPLLGPFPKPAWFGNAAQVTYVFVVRATGAVLANLFAWADTTFYATYADLGDQSAAGAVMMAEESVVMVAVLAWLLGRWIHDAGQRQELIELADARGVALDERRIARAVAAGRGADLRRRLDEPGSERPPVAHG